MDWGMGEAAASEETRREGNPRSPINQGTLCPKGSASRRLVQQPGRLTKVRYPRRRARAMPSRRNEKRFSRSAGARLTAWAAPRPSTP
jgi:anaerobic selenocysteine-containing dehydrogenase